MLSTFKDNIKESQLYFSRATIMIAICIGLTFILVGRLAYLQIYQNIFYQQKSLNNQIRVISVAPTRGVIYDRNGKIIAQNLPTYSLDITPEKTKNVRNTINEISKIVTISAEDRKNFFAQMKLKKKYNNVPIKLNLTETEVAKLSLTQYKFPEISITATLTRNYPYGRLLAHAIGYIGPISEEEYKGLSEEEYLSTYYIGKTGVEKFYEKQLHGSPGYQYVETDAKGRAIRTLKEIHPHPGSNLHLSLDVDLQIAAQKALQGYKGAIVVINPKTGEVLAMASTPTYDPNLFVHGISNEQYDALTRDPSRPLFNRALTGQYPPASTIKPIVATRALDGHNISAKLKIFDPGFFKLPNDKRVYRDWKRHGHGWISMENAIAESCSTYFYDLANRIGINSLSEAYASFGLGSKLGIDSTGELTGLVPTAPWKQRRFRQPWFPGETLNTGIGQGFMLATPLQIANVATIFANRGKNFRPRLVNSITSTSINSGQKINIKIPQTPGKEIKLNDQKVWETVINGMVKTIKSPNGTAHRVHYMLNKPIAGKTGTAQVFGLKQDEQYEAEKIKQNLRDHSWFMAFTPVNNPQIAVAAVVENTKGQGVTAAASLIQHYYEIKKKQGGKYARK